MFRSPRKFIFRVIFSSKDVLIGGKVKEILSDLGNKGGEEDIILRIHIGSLTLLIIISKRIQQSIIFLLLLDQILQTFYLPKRKRYWMIEKP